MEDPQVKDPVLFYPHDHQPGNPALYAMITGILSSDFVSLAVLSEDGIETPTQHERVQLYRGGQKPDTYYCVPYSLGSESARELPAPEVSEDASEEDPEIDTVVPADDEEAEA
jgi:hypothetical protein